MRHVNRMKKLQYNINCKDGNYGKDSDQHSHKDVSRSSCEVLLFLSDFYKT
jgi:hypothetical protein